MDRIRYHDWLIEAKRLSLCSPEYIYDYLKEHASDGLPEVFFETLFNRNNELIRLGLAKFCDDKEILRKLFYGSASVQDGEVLRCAIFSNPHCDFGMYPFGTFKKEELKGILGNATDAELTAIMGNKSVEGHELSDIFKRSGWAENLTDEQWFSCCVYALHENPNLRGDYESLHGGYHDGPMVACHNEVLEAAWQLLETAPVTFEWTANLMNAFSDFPRILLPCNCKDDFFIEVFGR